MALYKKETDGTTKLLAGGTMRQWVGTQERYDEVKDTIPNNTMIIITDQETDYENDIPIGTILQYKGDTAPNGYLFTDGSTFDENAYPALYNILGSNELPEIFDGEPEIGASVSQTITASTAGTLYEFTAEHDGVLVAHMEATNGTQTFGMIRITDTTIGIIYDSKASLTQYPVWTTTCPLKKGHTYSIWYRNDASGATYTAWRRIGYSTTEPRIIKALDAAATADFNTQQTENILNAVDNKIEATYKEGTFTYGSPAVFNAPSRVHVWQEGHTVHLSFNCTLKAAGNNTWITYGTISGVDLPSITEWCGVGECGGVAWPIRINTSGEVLVFAGGTLASGNTIGGQACYPVSEV